MAFVSLRFIFFTVLVLLGSPSHQITHMLLAAYPSPLSISPTNTSPDTHPWPNIAATVVNPLRSDFRSLRNLSNTFPFVPTRHNLPAATKASWNPALQTHIQF